MNKNLKKHLGITGLFGPLLVFLLVSILIFVKVIMPSMSYDKEDMVEWFSEGLEEVMALEYQIMDSEEKDDLRFSRKSRWDKVETMLRAYEPLWKDVKGMSLVIESNRGKISEIQQKYREKGSTFDAQYMEDLKEKLKMLEYKNNNHDLIAIYAVFTLFLLYSVVLVLVIVGDLRGNKKTCNE